MIRAKNKKKIYYYPSWMIVKVWDQMKYIPKYQNCYHTLFECVITNTYYQMRVLSISKLFKKCTEYEMISYIWKTEIVIPQHEKSFWCI